MYIQNLVNKKLAQPPKWLPDNVHYLTIMGSLAYGVSSDSSDLDLYGFCIPPKELVFPHLAGNIPGFGRQINHFESWQQHHMHDPSARAGQGQTIDATVFSIVKFFHLCMENNPNMVDALYTPASMVVQSTQIGQLVKESRDLFLHKGCWHKFKGYAYSQLHKIDIKNPEPGSKRAELVEQYGYDVKFAYHVVRLMQEVEMILAEGTLDLVRGNEVLKAIRRGEWAEAQIRQYFTDKERQLEDLYHKSALPHKPDEPRIKALLLQCLEMHYGTLEGAVHVPDRYEQALRDINDILAKVRIA
jgi:predicted nucleotidyltransferase